MVIYIVLRKISVCETVAKCLNGDTASENLEFTVSFDANFQRFACQSAQIQGFQTRLIYIAIVSYSVLYSE